MRHPAVVLPELTDCLKRMMALTGESGVTAELLALIHLRASQINGCGPCVDGASHEARRLGVDDERLFAVAAWNHTPFFSEPERAVLALTEAATRLSAPA